MKAVRAANTIQASSADINNMQGCNAYASNVNASTPKTSTGVYSLDSLQIQSVLRAINTRQAVNVRSEDGRLTANAYILGADFPFNPANELKKSAQQTEILIGELFPEISARFIDSVSREPLWLRLRVAERYLTVKLSINDISNGLISAHIIHTSWSANQRWDSRVTFPAHGGPKVRLNREFNTNIEARLTNLSVGGLAVAIWGKELNSEFRKTQSLTCSLQFNRHFELSLDATIIESRFKRNPSCHTHLRMRFDRLDTLTHRQLLHFVEASFDAETAA